MKFQCEWLLGERRPSLHNFNDGLDPDESIYKAIMSNPHIQLSLTNPKMLLGTLHFFITLIYCYRFHENGMHYYLHRNKTYYYLLIQCHLFTFMYIYFLDILYHIFVRSVLIDVGNSNIDERLGEGP